MKKKPVRKPSKEKKSLRDQTVSERRKTFVRFIGYGFVIALLVVIVMMVASQFFPDTAILSVPRKMVSRLITPIQGTFSSVTDGVAGYLRQLKRRSNLEYEYEQLRIKVDELTDQAMLVNELRDALQVANDFGDEIDRNRNLDGVMANIIGRDTSNYTFTLTIDKGTDSGIEDNMAVTVPGALIGYTYDVEKSSAKVLCIVDSSASVSALIESSRDQGLLKGTLAVDGKYACRMYYLSFTTLPRPGDRVVTLGAGMEFPKGIPIGYVRESTRGLEDSKQYIVIDPIADFDHLEYVIVYRYRPPFAEIAEPRGANVDATFVPLPSMQPAPTLIGQQPPELTPGPDGQMPATETPAPTLTPSPAPTPVPTADPNATAVPESFGYNEKIVVEGTATPEPTAEPTATPAPTPTFSVDQLTVEEEG